MIKIIKAGIGILNVLYGFLKLCPTQNKIVMISRQSNSPSMEFQMLEEEIHKRDKGKKVVLLCKTLDGGIESSFWSKAGYCLHLFTQMYHLATSRAAILDSYCIAVSVLKHKKSLTVIQMWHSMGTMKKFGYTSLDTSEGSRHELAYAMKMHQNYDYVFASAEAYKDHLAKGFQCDIDKIVTMPLPRLDLLKSKDYADKVRSRIFQKFPELKEKPVILYCPTFRKNEEEFKSALQQLIETVDQTKYNLIIKLHPLSVAGLNDDVMEARGFTSFEMLFAADYVISDYSCIVYEAAVRNIPLFFYNFDMELYRNGRGLAIDYEKELPGVISGEAEEIVRAIENHEYDMERLRRFSDKYVTPVDHATQDIVDFIFQCMEKNR